MKKQLKKLKADIIRWKQFSRKNDAIFRSLGKEIVILTLSVATLTFALPQNARAQKPLEAMNGDMEQDEDTLQEVVVVATKLPTTLSQTTRLVQCVDAAQLTNKPFFSVNDALKLLPSVDVRQRGPWGIQTDITINGGTQDQILILLDGVNISSPHTGHLTTDFPFSENIIDHVEILDGAAGRVYGTSAFAGAVNFVTKKNNFQDNKNLHAQVALTGGSFGTASVEAGLQIFNKKAFHRFSSSYTRSDGGTANSDFNKTNVFYNGGRENTEMSLNWNLGVAIRNFGANTFYSGKYPNQYEQTRKLTGSVSMRTKGRVALCPTIYWNKSLDHFQLVKDSDFGENYHMVDVYGLTVNALTTWKWGTTVIGVDYRNEGILSTSLGKPLDESQYVNIVGSNREYSNKDNRSNFAYYIEHNYNIDNWRFSFGLMANMNTSLDHHYRFYPGADISYRLSQHWKLFVSWNTAQRMPTFTDLYYKSPTQEGNIGLKPEKTNDLSLAADYHNRWFDLNARLFYRHDKNMIDWVMTEDDVVNDFTTYHAIGFKLDRTGFNVNACINLCELTHDADFFISDWHLGYAYNIQNRRDKIKIVASSYALDYLKHKFVTSLAARFFDKLFLNTTFRFQKRVGQFIKYELTKDTEGNIVYSASTHKYKPYGLLGVNVIWKEKRYDVFLNIDNLTGAKYYDIGNVEQPGCWVMAGVKIKL